VRRRPSGATATHGHPNKSHQCLSRTKRPRFAQSMRISCLLPRKPAESAPVRPTRRRRLCPIPMTAHCPNLATAEPNSVSLMENMWYDARCIPTVRPDFSAMAQVPPGQLSPRGPPPVPSFSFISAPSRRILPETVIVKTFADYGAFARTQKRLGTAGIPLLWSSRRPVSAQ
jgi:hypothetical protein